LFGRLKDNLKNNDLSEIISDKEVQKAVKSWVSLNRWSVFLFLILTSSIMIFYVYNVISINRLAEEIRHLEKQEKRVEFRKRMFEAEVIKLQSAERICKIAEEKLHMVKSEEFPTILSNKNAE
jgi:cell division protein FtsL